MFFSATPKGDTVTTSQYTTFNGQTINNPHTLKKKKKVSNLTLSILIIKIRKIPSIWVCTSVDCIGSGVDNLDIDWLLILLVHMGYCK
jgi:hypothetical protein